MKNGKKLLTVFISLVLIVTLMSGCGNNKQDETTTAPTTTAPTTTAPTTTAPTTQPIISTTAPTTTQASTTETTTTPTTTTQPSTEEATSAAPTVNFPLVNENNEFTFTLNADGTFVHSGVYNMDLSSVGFDEALPIAVETKGNYTVTSGSFSLVNTKMTINCSDETINQLSGFVKMAAKALKNVELTDKSTVSLNAGQLAVTFIGNNGTQNYTFSTHTFTIEETSGILSK